MIEWARNMELVTERLIERFLERLFLRETKIRCIYIASPFIATLTDSRFPLSRLRNKIEKERIPTYIICQEPDADYQKEAMKVLSGCQYIELRFNPFLHAKLYMVLSEIEKDSFALFGSGNLTSKAINHNIELGIMIYNLGYGKEMIGRLEHWVNSKLRTMQESLIQQAIKTKRR